MPSLANELASAVSWERRSSLNLMLLGQDEGSDGSWDRIHSKPARPLKGYPPKLSLKLRNALEDNDFILIVSTSSWEIATKWRLGKLHAMAVGLLLASSVSAFALFEGVVTLRCAVASASGNHASHLLGDAEMSHFSTATQISLKRRCPAMTGGLALPGLKKQIFHYPAVAVMPKLYALIA